MHPHCMCQACYSSIHNWDITDHCAVSYYCHTAAATAKHGPLICSCPVTAGALSHPIHALTDHSFSSPFPTLSLLRLFCIIGLSAQGQFIAKNCRHPSLTHEKVKPTNLFWCLSRCLSCSFPSCHHPGFYITLLLSRNMFYSCTGNALPHSPKELLFCLLEQAT